MEKRNPLTLTLDQPFVAGTDDFSPFYNRLHKLNCAIILYCRAGRGTMAIDLKKYEITVNTQVVLLPGAVISLDEKSDDFRVSFFASHIEMFREACIRFEPSFFHFIKEKPCYTLPSEFTAPINGLLHATSAIYADTDHRFRNLNGAERDLYRSVPELHRHRHQRAQRAPEHFSGFFAELFEQRLVG